MKIRGPAWGITALALLVVPGALAQAPQEPAGAAQDAASPAGIVERAGPVPSPKPASLELRLRRVRNGEVDVGKRLVGVGTIRPFVRGQNIRMFIKRGRRDLKRVNLPIKRVAPGRNVGIFRIRSPRLIKPAKYRVGALKIETPEQEGASRMSRSVEIDYPNLDPGDRGRKVSLLNKLLDKKAYHTSRGKSYGSATGRAVLAFRKVNNMRRTTNATPGIFRKLAAGKGGFKLKWPGGGKHIETDLSRQVMVLAKGGKAKHIFHISSGAPATPTVRGKFPTYRKDFGTNSLGMIHSVYFIRGYATHGYRSVPTYPASHGCLRNPPANALFIYKWIDYGDVFYVYG